MTVDTNGVQAASIATSQPDDPIGLCALHQISQGYDGSVPFAL